MVQAYPAAQHARETTLILQHIDSTTSSSAGQAWRVVQRLTFLGNFDPIISLLGWPRGHPTIRSSDVSKIKDIIIKLSYKSSSITVVKHEYRITVVKTSYRNSSGFLSWLNRMRPGPSQFSYSRWYEILLLPTWNFLRR